ncbi:MAG: hypothetical protein PVF47_10740 [Anaerolineae bacterium]
MLAVDLSGLVPEARPIVDRVAGVYMRRMAPWFVGLLAHGSAVKGGYIPGCSDVDLQLYLADDAFDPRGQLPLALGLAVRRDLEPIDTAPFRYVQCYARDCGPRAGWVGPIPGAYHLVAGRLPIPEATAAELRASAARALAVLNPFPSHIMGRLLGHGSERLARSLRLLCTQVWPVLYHVLAVQAADAVAVWNLTKEQAIAALPPASSLRREAEAFHRAVWAYYPAENSLEGALTLIEHGVNFLGAAKAWWLTQER